MSLPKLTHLQYLILSILFDDAAVYSRSGRYVRDCLYLDNGITQSGSAFHQAMKRLELVGYVTSSYVTERTVKSIWYKITRLGISEKSKVKTFYKEN